MDYEKKYNEALKWMRSLYSGLHGQTKEEAEQYFPELKESEDERIRKAIIGYIDHGQHYGISNADMLAWLEKQGETSYNPYKAAVESIAKMCKKYALDMDDAEWADDKDVLKRLRNNEPAPKTLNADKVIDWLEKNWPYKREWGSRSSQVDEAINQFKQDFEI